jgi:hypothetical protein
VSIQTVFPMPRANPVQRVQLNGSRYLRRDSSTRPAHRKISFAQTSYGVRIRNGDRDCVSGFL